jgi:DNA repair protein RadC
MAEGRLSEAVKSLGLAGYGATRSPAAIRLFVYGTDGLADWEIVELLLQASITRRDTATLAQLLIEKFASLAGVLSANAYELDAVAGIGPREVANLKAVQAVAVKLIKARLHDGPLLQNWDRLSNYLTAVLSHENVEHLRVLFLNTKNMLIGEELLGRGTVSRVAVYPREIVKRALELHATAVILAHNHPSGDPTPSDDDVEMTINIMDALKAVEIVLHDHIIAGPGVMASFRKLGFPPFAHISANAPYHQNPKAFPRKARPT